MRPAVQNHNVNASSDVQVQCWHKALRAYQTYLFCPQMTLLRRTSIELVPLILNFSFLCFFFMFQLSACFHKYGHGLHGVGHHWYNCHHCRYCYHLRHCHHCVNCLHVSANLHVSTFMALDSAVCIFRPFLFSTVRERGTRNVLIRPHYDEFRQISQFHNQFWMLVIKYMSLER